ncbi:hypothetical protein NXX87_26195 [Bacteroides faecis]|uniref:hypothetical protein n=1 Tax=Bacteroides faecis TaxID=674529 RepID=UPI0021649D81|nr:hypothetical protein [Bacteroides faecis]MCY1133817.1 hypothetical protein [Bacteroides fragilis]UVS34145.1 hypothetical protein NXX87_26195 [Bacteroides faecis]
MKKHSCLPVRFQICEPEGILARLPVHLPACQSACPCACLPARWHTGIGAGKCQRA